MKLAFHAFVIALIAIVTTESVEAGQITSTPFSAGNLVVYRVGDGVTSLSSSASQVYLDEYTTSGVLVQSVAAPSSGLDSFVASGTATSEGMITLSADGSCLVFTGYNAALGTAKIASTTGAAAARVVATVDASGNLVTRKLGTASFSGNNIRGAASTNGEDVWVSGGATPGLAYLQMSGSGETQVSSSLTNVRGAEIFGGQLYASSSSGSYKGVNTVGSGLATTSGQTAILSAASSNPNAFFLADLDAGVAGFDTMYVADDGVGLEKFALVGGSWTLVGSIGSAADTYRGLTGVVSGGTVTLYATTYGGGSATGGGKLVAVSDSSGYDMAINGSATVLATASNYTAFRGVAFAPSAVPEPATIVMLGLALVGALFGVRRR